jgi:multiple sugar transport system substrate-binding protein
MQFQSEEEIIDPHGGRGIGRRALLGAALAALLLGAALPAFAQEEPSGELVMMNWVSGSELDFIKELEAGFVKKYPKVHFNDIDLSGSGDMRGAIRTALLGGQRADLVQSGWPSFLIELQQAGLIRPLGDAWEQNNWSDSIGDNWKKFMSIDGVPYGLTYTFGDRSGIFYRKDTLAKAGIAAPPKTWDEFVTSFGKLNAVGVTPIAVPGKVWSHAEWFETIYIRMFGVDMAKKLGAHEIPWTDASVKTALKKYAEIISLGCCGDAATMLASDWDNAADSVLKAGTAGYEMIGMWVNRRAQEEYGLKEGEDYALFQFPEMGLGHDDTSIVDTNAFLVLSSGQNPTAATAFLSYTLSAEGANIIAKHGVATPSNKVDTALYGPVTLLSNQAVASTSSVSPVIGDLLPGDLVDEYRVQLQKFLQDPSDANIDAVTAAIEAKADTVY